MKKRLTILITILVCAMFSVAANDFSAQGKRVAILPFIVKGNFDALYAEVAQDNFKTELIKCDLYQIVMKSNVNKAMKDLKLQGSDIDESSAMEVGKLTGAQIVVISEIIALKNQTVVNIRGINVETGITDFQERTFLKSENELLVSVENIARKISGLEPKVSNKQQSAIPDFSAKEKNTVKKTTNKKSNQTRNNLEPTLTESEKRFIRKFYKVKLGINPNHILTWWQEKRVKEKIADYQNRGRSLLFGGIGGCLGALSGAPTIALGSYFPFLYAVFGIVVGVSFVACTIVALCSIPYYVYASKIKKTFNYIQNNSFRSSNFTSTDNEKKGFDVALLSCSF